MAQPSSRLASGLGFATDGGGNGWVGFGGRTGGLSKIMTSQLDFVPDRTVRRYLAAVWTILDMKRRRGTTCPVCRAVDVQAVNRTDRGGARPWRFSFPQPRAKGKLLNWKQHEKNLISRAARLTKAWAIFSTLACLQGASNLPAFTYTILAHDWISGWSAVAQVGGALRLNTGSEDRSGTRGR